jgi:hypothetical protein
MRTIFLTKGKEEVKEGVQIDAHYYATSLTKSEYELLMEAFKNKELEALSVTFGINCCRHKIIGEPDRAEKSLSISQKISHFMGTFTANTAGERQRHYRDYTKTYSRQLDTAWLINIAPDYKVSWNTLMLALQKPEYVFIWFDCPTKIYDNVTYS